MKKKVLVFLRVSTEKQEIEAQKIEMVEFVQGYGYGMRDIIFVEDKGASAIKLNQKYLDMIDDINYHVDSGEIDCIAIWAINRLARNEIVFAQVKEKLISNKIQLLVKNPNLQLLNPDGSVNKGSELALGLFSVMSSQEMIEKKERFKRKKKHNAINGKFNGGRFKRFGYTTNEKGFYILDENESNIVRDVFSLYSTGNYTSSTLAKEISLRYNIDIQAFKIVNILNFEGYTGKEVLIKRCNLRIYPAIISIELFERCKEIRDSNKLLVRKAENRPLASKLIKCSKCGSVYTSNSKQYSCEKKSCDMDLTIKKNVIEDILWTISSQLHLKYMIEEREVNTKEIKEKILINSNKLISIDKKLNDLNLKKERVIDSYIEGLIDDENKRNKLEKIKSEGFVLNSEKTRLNELILSLNKVLEELMNGDLENIIFNSIDQVNLEDKFEIIHKYIQSVYLERENKSVLIHVNTISGIYDVLYYPYKKENKILYKEIIPLI